MLILHLQVYIFGLLITQNPYFLLYAEFPHRGNTANFLPLLCIKLSSVVKSDQIPLFITNINNIFHYLPLFDYLNL